MAFSQADITSVIPPVPIGVEIKLAWTSTAPAGTMYQVYVNQDLAWHGTTLFAFLLPPPELATFTIGTVGPGEGTTNFFSDLPPAPETKAILSWIGGTFEAPDIAGFYVYGEATPGGGINYATPLANIQAYTPGVVTDGYGMGGYGQGGYGAASASYEWESGSLTSGTWNFVVAPYDMAGNVGVIATTSQVIAVPPLAPALYPGTAIRLIYTYSPSTYEITLAWNASPTLD